MPRQLRYALSTDQLWPLIVLAGAVFYLSLTPLPPNDFWWHLKIGELIWTQGAIPNTNLFAWTLSPDQPYFYGAWLGETWLYGLYALGGLEWVIFGRNLVIGGAFWLAAFSARRHSGSWRLSAAALALLLLMTLGNLIVRPQIWAWIPFALYVLVLNGVSFGRLSLRWLALLPLLMLLWVNLHGSFLIGGLLIGVYFAGSVMHTLTGATEGRSWRQSAALLGCGLAAGAAMLFNPSGLGVLSYVLNLLGNQPVQQLTVEWQPPTPSGVANLSFFASTLLLLAALNFSRARLHPSEALVVLIFTWLAWTGERQILWYALAVTPILARLLSQLPLPQFSGQAPKSLLNSLLALLLFIPCLMVQPWWIEAMPLSDAYWSQVRRGSDLGPLVSADTPEAAVEYLRQNPGGKLFNEMAYGSYLIWALPEQGVFVDPRIELYPYQQWQDYIYILRGVRYNQLLEKYGADRLLLERKRQAELILALEADTGWLLEYQDDYTQIWRKTAPPND